MSPFASLASVLLLTLAAASFGCSGSRSTGVGGVTTNAETATVGGGSGAAGPVQVTGSAAGSGGGSSARGSSATSSGNAGAMPGSGPLAPIHLYLIGDSTMADKPTSQRVERGWGQMMPAFFVSQLRVSNHAKNGRSSKSFLGEGLWKAVFDRLAPNDWVIIQFGHNDSKSDSARSTVAFTTYSENLRKYVNEARSKGAHPILATSIVRGNFSGNTLQDTHGEYPEATRAVALELKVPLFDLEQGTAKLVSEYGPSRLKELYVPADSTHLNPFFATQVAEMAVAAIREQGLTLEAYLK